jgi:hypothetical protein
VNSGEAKAVIAGDLFSARMGAKEMVVEVRFWPLADMATARPDVGD